MDNYKDTLQLLNKLNTFTTTHLIISPSRQCTIHKHTPQTVKINHTVTTIPHNSSKCHTFLWNAQLRTYDQGQQILIMDRLHLTCFHIQSSIRLTLQTSQSTFIQFDTNFALSKNLSIFIHDLLKHSLGGGVSIHSNRLIVSFYLLNHGHWSHTRD